MSSLVSPESIRDAAKAMRGAVVRTPLLQAPWLEGLVESPGRCAIRLKCENLQQTGSFKARGAFTIVKRMSRSRRQRGVVTYSSGNHAQAVAYAAMRFGVPAVVVMPTTAPAVKVEGARRLGATVVFQGTTSVERRAKAEEISRDRGLVVAPPFDHEDVIAGQGTVGYEILRDWPGVEAVLVPVGGGGLLSGVAAWIKHHKPECAVIGVEPENAAAMRRSLEAGSIVELESVDTIADGLAPVRPGELTFQHARRLVDDVITVSDDSILHAAKRLLFSGRLLVEFSGAAGVAAVLDGRWDPVGCRTAIVLTGGNIAPERLISESTTKKT